MYNEVIATTTTFDTMGTSLGYTVKVTTYNYFDLLIYLAIPIILFVIIRLFFKK